MFADFEQICEQGVPAPWEEEHGLYAMMVSMSQLLHCILFHFILLIWSEDYYKRLKSQGLKFASDNLKSHTTDVKTPWSMTNFNSSLHISQRVNLFCTVG